MGIIFGRRLSFRRGRFCEGNIFIEFSNFFWKEGFQFLWIFQREDDVFLGAFLGGEYFNRIFEFFSFSEERGRFSFAFLFLGDFRRGRFSEESLFIIFFVSGRWISIYLFAYSMGGDFSYFFFCGGVFCPLPNKIEGKTKTFGGIHAIGRSFRYYRNRRQYHLYHP